MRRAVAASAAAMAGLLVVTGCAAGAGTGAVGSPSVDGGSAGAPAATPTAAIVAPDNSTTPSASAPAMTQTGIVDGADFDVDSIRGTDVVLWFWAPWCPTCRRQAGILAEALPRLPDSVTVIGVAGLTDDPAQVEQFVDEYGVDQIMHVSDLDGEVWRTFEVVSQSTFVFLDDSGMLTETGASTTADDIVARAEALAASSS